MGRQRQRFNARARQSSNATEKHFHVVTQVQDDPSLPSLAPMNPHVNPNALILDPHSQHEHTRSLHAFRVEQERLARENSKQSIKKRKKLEVFIQKRLKKEARPELLKSLAETSFTGMSGLLRSSRDLERKKRKQEVGTVKERLRMNLEAERQGLSAPFPETPLIMKPKEIDSDSEENSQSDQEDSQSSLDVPSKKPDFMFMADNDSQSEEELVREQEMDLAGLERRRKKRKERKKNQVKMSRVETIESSSDSDDDVVKETFTLPKTATVNADTSQPSTEPTSNSTKAFFVPVHRPSHIEEQRQHLPILDDEQRLLELLQEQDVVILTGTPGCGKTTQVPQFLYEAGYGCATGPRPGRIAITQPRRVAAVSMAKRVSEEMALQAPIIAHQIRYENTASSQSVMVFMTDGILMQALSKDFLLLDYSAILIDEAHERTLNTDLLIGLLSRSVRLRREMIGQMHGNTVIKTPLKLIIMSATLNVKVFSENKRLFPSQPPALLHVSAPRPFPVTVHYKKRTPENYITACFTSICKVHERLPDGNILVFVPGQQDIQALCKQLNEKYGQLNDSQQHEQEAKNEFDDEQDDDFIQDEDRNVFDDADCEEDNESDDEIQNESEKQESVTQKKLLALPLYAQLSPQQQMRVFQSAPIGTRLCIVSTNVAETSLTLSNIRYVIDTGKVKQRITNSQAVHRYQIEWISKASAEQRLGRAGRTAPGHCYRLYSSTVYAEQFPDHARPEIEKLPLEGIVLHMKAMHLDRLIHFPFPTAPDPEQLKLAQDHLMRLGALDKKEQRITALGLAMSPFPVMPRFAKLLVLAQQQQKSNSNVLGLAIILVAALSVPGDWIQIHLPGVQVHESDLIRWLLLCGAYFFACTQKNEVAFCQQFGLSTKAMKEIKQLTRQLAQKMALTVDPTLLSPPHPSQIRQLKCLVLKCFTDQIAKYDASDKAYHVLGDERPCSIHATSSLYALSTQPLFVMFTERFQASHSEKLLLKGVTALEPEWLSRLEDFCDYKRVEDAIPSYDPVQDCVMALYEPFISQWPLPTVKRPLTSDTFRYFAKALLDGQVFTTFKPKCLSPSHLLLKRQGLALERCLALILALQKAQIDTKAKLMLHWKKNSQFLLNELKSWIAVEEHERYFKSWPLN